MFCIIYASDYTHYKYLDGLTKKAAVLRRIKIEFLFKELYPTGAHVPQIRGDEMYLVCKERFKDILKYLNEDVKYILLYKDVLNNPNIISYKINDTRKMYERKFYIHKDNYEYRRCDNAEDIVLIKKLDSYKINNEL